MTRKALAAMQAAVARVVEQHRRDGRPLALWRNGKAVLVRPETLTVVRESAASYKTRARGKKG
ncbi:MAG TPA: hypothetical protein VLZ30_11875 [Verrucomicrobiae bacterium]|nr:hypothetical protein [Verrucomicrobiae bacterium]